MRQAAADLGNRYFYERNQLLARATIAAPHNRPPMRAQLYEAGDA
jgi:hypothetical protein